MLFGGLICAVKDREHRQMTGVQELSLPRMLAAALGQRRGVWF